MASQADTLADYTDFDMRIQHNSDTWSYNAAHPDHTIVLAGPPRYGDTAPASSALKTIGAFQSFVMSSAKPWQPYQPIGQIATAFLGGKTQNQAQISRLLINAPNLLASLYAGYGNTFPEALNNIDSNAYTAAGDGDQTYWINLDNPLFHVPIGLAMIFRTKNQATVGGVYIELALIQSFQTQIQMGQAMILENVGLIFDRALPLTFYNLGTSAGLDEADAGFTAVAAAGPGG